MLPICEKCESNNVVCTALYNTDGASIETYVWTHKCKDCGHIKTKNINQCYGMGGAEEVCALGCGRKYSESTDEKRTKDIVEILSAAHIESSTDPEVLCNADFRKFNYEQRGGWQDIVKLQDELRMICRRLGQPWAL